MSHTALTAANFLTGSHLEFSNKLGSTAGALDLGK
jgi:hypothetical protein